MRVNFRFRRIRRSGHAMVRCLLNLPRHCPSLLNCVRIDSETHESLVHTMPSRLFDTWEVRDAAWQAPLEKNLSPHRISVSNWFNDRSGDKSITESLISNTCRRSRFTSGCQPVTLQFQLASRRRNLWFDSIFNPALSIFGLRDNVSNERCSRDSIPSFEIWVYSRCSRLKLSRERRNRSPLSVRDVPCRSKLCKAGKSVKAGMPASVTDV